MKKNRKNLGYKMSMFFYYLSLISKKKIGITLIHIIFDFITILILFGMIIFLPAFFH